jgi:hypothetical protein
VAISCLLKVVIFQQQSLKQYSANDIFANIMGLYPLTGDCFEARESHMLLLTLFIQGDRRLLWDSKSAQFLRVLSIIADIINTYRQVREEFDTKYSAKPQEHDAYWEESNVPNTMGEKIEYLLANGPYGITKKELQLAMHSLSDEKKSVFEKWF